MVTAGGFRPAAGKLRGPNQGLFVMQKANRPQSLSHNQIVVYQQPGVQMAQRSNVTALKNRGNRIADELATALEERIVSGVLQEGQKLPTENEMMKEFGISRSPIREAIKTLDSRGFVEALPKHRPVVKGLGYDAISDVIGGLARHLINQPGGVRKIFDMRIFVEAGLVRMAALEAVKADIARLRAALEENGDQIQDSDKFYDTDMAFHGVLYAVPRNPIFITIHRSFNDWLDWHWRQMPRLPERNARNFEAHKAIFDAILNRDPDEAEAALRRHLEDAWKQVKNTFDDV